MKKRILFQTYTISQNEVGITIKKKLAHNIPKARQINTKKRGKIS